MTMQNREKNPHEVVFDQQVDGRAPRNCYLKTATEKEVSTTVDVNLLVFGEGLKFLKYIAIGATSS